MTRQMQKGFTLIELMIVVAIIGILAAVGIPQYQDYITKAKLSKVVGTADPIKLALAQTFQDNGGGLPTGFAGAEDGDAAGWASLGLNAAPTHTTEVSSIDLADTGILTLTLTGVGPGIDGQTVAFSPVETSTSMNWAVSCTGSPTATNSGNQTLLQAQVKKWTNATDAASVTAASSGC